MSSWEEHMLHDLATQVVQKPPDGSIGPYTEVDAQRVNERDVIQQSNQECSRGTCPLLAIKRLEDAREGHEPQTRQLNASTKGNSQPLQHPTQHVSLNQHDVIEPELECTTPFSILSRSKRNNWDSHKSLL